MTINNDIDIGAGALTLSGAGAIVNGGTATLTASTVSLEQDAVFTTTEPFAFGSIGSLALITEAAQVVHNWMIADGRSLTVTSAGTVFVRSAIGSGDRNLGAGDITLESTGGTVRIFVGITTTGAITLIGGTGGINFDSRGAKTLSGGTVMLSGNARSNRDLTLTTTSGALTLNGDITTGTSALSLMGATISIAGDSGTTRTLSGGAITLTGVATGAANLTINASGTLTINNNITLTGAVLTLTSSGAGAIVGGASTPELTASTVRLTQVSVFGATALFTFGGATGSLVLITTDATDATDAVVDQSVHNWMINDGINLTVMSPSRVIVEANIGDGETGRDIGDGSITLTSTGAGISIAANIETTGAITLDGATGINTSGAARELRGAGITLVGRVRSLGANLTLIASGTLTLSSNVDTATRNNATFGDLTLEGATIQIGRAASTTVNTTRILLRGGAITLTSADGIQIGRFSGAGTFSTNGGVANLTVTASGVLTIAGNITVASTAASGGDILLTGGSIAFGDAARTITGRDITLTGAATGTADLTITTSGTLTLNNNITVTGAVLTLALSGAGAIGDGSSTAVLTASTVRLRQVDVFSGTQSPFTISTSTPSLELTTDAAQVVLDWMIADGRNLTVTSALNVIVRSAIGSGDRNLGNGNLTLTSMTGFVRIFADILTTGNITLSGTGATGINLNSGRAKTLSGAAITLNGNARSNRAVTITASSTLTLNNDITVTGATRTLALRGAGAIVATTGRPRLAASTVRLTQTDAFAAGENGIGLFRFRPGSLMLNTDAAQVVHDWMIAPSRDVTITSAGTVRVGADIGADVPGRNLGVRSLTLVSTGADIRIEADITITGNITLNGSTGIDLSGAARTITGGAIALTGVAMSDANVTITATGALRLNSNIALTGAGSTLALRGAGAIGNGGAVRVLTASTVSLRQVDVFGATVLFTFGAVAATGSLELTTDAAQVVHDWMITLNRNLTVTSAGIVRVAAAIGSGESGRNLGNGDLTLESTGGAVRILADISTTGDLTLDGATGINLNSGGAKTLSWRNRHAHRRCAEQS